jgi:glycogen debranching enzyme
MKETIKYQDKYYYILASSSIMGEQERILKDDKTLGIFNISGNIRPLRCENHGIFYRETRYLSRMLLNIGQMHPVLLSSAVKYDNQHLSIDMTNPDFIDNNREMVEKDILHIRSMINIKDRLCCRKDRIFNFGCKPYLFHISYHFDADFIDISELMGIKRQKHGTVKKPSYGKDNIIFTFTGLDNIKRGTEILFSVTPDSIKDNAAQFEILIYPEKSLDIEIDMAFREGIKRNSRIYK